jgi:hypothetical protein
VFSDYEGRPRITVIEQIGEKPETFRVTASYGVYGHAEAHQLDKLLTHLSALVHGLAFAAEDEWLSRILHDVYGYDAKELRPTDQFAVYQRIIEECVALVRVIGSSNLASTVLPLTVLPPPDIDLSAPPLPER